MMSLQNKQIVCGGKILLKKKKNKWTNEAYNMKFFKQTKKDKVL